MVKRTDLISIPDAIKTPFLEMVQSRLDNLIERRQKLTNKEMTNTTKRSIESLEIDIISCKSKIENPKLLPSQNAMIEYALRQGYHFLDSEPSSPILFKDFGDHRVRIIASWQAGLIHFDESIQFLLRPDVKPTESLTESELPNVVRIEFQPEIPVFLQEFSAAVEKFERRGSDSQYNEQYLQEFYDKGYEEVEMARNGEFYRVPNHPILDDLTTAMLVANKESIEHFVSIYGYAAAQKHFRISSKTIRKMLKESHQDPDFSGLDEKAFEQKFLELLRREVKTDRCKKEWEQELVAFAKESKKRDTCHHKHIDNLH